MALARIAAALAAAALPAALRAASPEDAVIRPGQAWFDTDGNRIYAGGANMYEEAGTYYMIGEGKKVLGADCSACFNMYKTTDLQNWDFVGCALNNSAIVAPAPYANEPFYRMERPKILKCPSTGKYVMWFHCDTAGFAMRSVGVLTSDAVEGPYEFAAPCFRPDGQDSYDMGTFYDDPVRGGDGRSYLIRSVRNQFAGISQMTLDCLNTTGIVSQGPDMEGQAIMRDTAGVLHAAGSHLTGWASNAAQFVTSPNASLVGAAWVNNYNPSGNPTTYDSQSTFIFPFTHANGNVTYIWMADRWNANGPGGLDNMTAIWLPLLPPATPAGPPGPAQAGWTLSLAPCNGSDDTQSFEFDASSSAVRYAPSGGALCVAQNPSASANSGLTQLVLAPCGAGNAAQQWVANAAAGTINNSTGSSCVQWNNANNVLPAGNPVIAYACGSGAPAWNARWAFPASGVAGAVQALDASGAPSGMCAAVGPAVPPGQWTLPWFDEWSLSQFA